MYAQKGPGKLPGPFFVPCAYPNTCSCPARAAIGTAASHHGSCVLTGLFSPAQLYPTPAYLAYLFAAECTYRFGWACLTGADELLPFTTGYEASDFYPGYFLIGAHDGEAFAIEKATGRFVETPFIGHDEETPITLGLTWPEFLEYLHAEYC